MQKYISLPSRTSVSSPSKRHAHKVVIKCPVSKLRLRLQTVETGHSFLFAMPLRKAQNLVKVDGQIYIFLQGQPAAHKDLEDKIPDETQLFGS